eukprot:670049-Prymnesium_polylepis.2
MVWAAVVVWAHQQLQSKGKDFVTPRKAGRAMSERPSGVSVVSCHSWLCALEGEETGAGRVGRCGTGRGGERWGAASTEPSSSATRPTQQELQLCPLTQQRSC